MIPKLLEAEATKTPHQGSGRFDLLALIFRPGFGLLYRMRWADLWRGCPAQVLS